MFRRWEEIEFKRSLETLPREMVVIPEESRSILEDSKRMPYSPMIEGQAFTSKYSVMPLSIRQGGKISSADVDSVMDYMDFIEESDDSESRINPVQGMVVDTEFGVGIIERVYVNDVLVRLPNKTEVKIPRGLAFALVNADEAKTIVKNFNKITVTLPSVTVEGVSVVISDKVKNDDSIEPVVEIVVPRTVDMVQDTTIIDSARPKDTPAKPDNVRPARIKPITLDEAKANIRKLAEAKKAAKLAKVTKPKDESVPNSGMETEDSELGTYDIFVHLLDGLPSLCFEPKDGQNNKPLGNDWHHLPSRLSCQIKSPKALQAFIATMENPKYKKLWVVSPDYLENLKEFVSLMKKGTMDSTDRSRWQKVKMFVTQNVGRKLRNPLEIRPLPLVSMDKLYMTVSIAQSPKAAMNLKKTKLVIPGITAWKTLPPLYAKIFMSKADIVKEVKRLNKIVDIGDYKSIVKEITDITAR